MIGNNDKLVLFLRLSSASCAAMVRAPVASIRSICAVPGDKIAVASTDGKCALLRIGNIECVAEGVRHHFRGLQGESSLSTVGDLLKKRRGIALASLAMSVVFLVLRQQRGAASIR
eukprot:IDg13930t1